MAILEIQGTKFSFSVISLKEEFWATTKIKIDNEYVRYENVNSDVSMEELENFVRCMHRLLAGAYRKEYAISFEKAGIAVDLYASTKDGKELSREERRKADCYMIFRVLLKDSTTQQALGGVYSFIFHKEAIQSFATQLQADLQKVLENRRQDGEYLYAGVSPKGYRGCNYWYLDKTKSTKAGDYVWVRMGRHNTEQVVYVDDVRYFTEETAPYPPSVVKQVLRKATQEEKEQAEYEWSKER